MINQVLKREEIYSGPRLDQAADLILVPFDGYDLKGTVKQSRVFARTDLVGMHTWDDAFFWSAAPPRGEVFITELCAIVLHSFGQ